MEYFLRQTLYRAAAHDRRISAGRRNRLWIRRHVHRDQPSDGGFVLLETVVSISLIVLVMAAFSTFFVNSVAFTNQQRATQVAIQIANSAVETMRAAPPADLINGQDAATVDAQFKDASGTVAPWLQGMSPAWVGSVTALPPP